MPLTIFFRKSTGPDFDVLVLICGKFLHHLMLFLKKVAFLGLPDYKVLDLELTSEVPAWDRLLLLRTDVPAGVCRRRVTGRMMVSLYERPASDRVSALQLSIINNHPHK